MLTMYVCIYTLKHQINYISFDLQTQFTMSLKFKWAILCCKNEQETMWQEERCPLLCYYYTRTYAYAYLSRKVAARRNMIILAYVRMYVLFINHCFEFTTQTSETTK